MIDAALALLAPHSCCGCGNMGDLLCESCKYDIISEPDERCVSCLVPTSRTGICDPCAKRMGIAGAWVVGARDGHLKRLLDRYKFKSAISGATVCAELLDARLPMLPSGIVVTAVPTVPTHVRSRGFDHAALIAKRLAKTRQLRYQTLMSRSGTATQHFRSRAERLRHAAEGLAVRRDVPGSVLLVDDIYTTGATIQACARVLAAAGVTQVYVAVVARQELDSGTDL